VADVNREDLNKLRDEIVRGLSDKQPRHEKTHDEKLKESGFGVFTEEGRKILLRISNRYLGDFRTFFLDLTARYTTDMRSTAEIKRINEVLWKITGLTNHISKLYASPDFRTAVEDVKVLKEKIADLDSEFVFFVTTETLTKTLKENIAKTEKATGISLEDMRYAQGVIGRKVQEISKPRSLFSGIGEGISEPLKQRGNELYKGLFTALLGPLAPLYPIGSAIWKSLRGTSLGDRATRKNALNEEEFNMTSVNVGRGGLSSVGRETIEERPSRREREWGGTRSTTLSSALSFQESLFLFFNTHSGGAYQARWTKELLEAVGGGKRQPDGDRRPLGMHLSDIGTALAKIAPLIPGIVGIGMGLWDAFKAQQIAVEKGWLGKPGEALSLDKKISVAIGAFLGGTGPGLGEKGAKADEVMKNIAWGMAKWAGIGSTIGGFLLPGLGNLLGAIIGGAIGAGLGALGGRRISLAVQAVKDATVRAATSISKGWQDYGIAGVAQNLASVMTFGLIPKISAKPDDQTLGQQAGVVPISEAATTEELAKAGISMPTDYGIPETGRTTAPQFGLTVPKSVPIDTSSSDAQKAQIVGLNKLYESFEEVNISIKDMNKSKTGKTPSGTDTNSTRHPLMSSLDAGTLSPV